MTRRTTESAKGWAVRRTCSPTCSGLIRRGRKRTPEQRAKMSEGRQRELALRGPRDPVWKGEGASYASIHGYILATYGRSNHCEQCDQDRVTQWANVSGRYKRAREDWRELCHQCHKRTDLGQVMVFITDERGEQVRAWRRPDGSLAL